MYTWPNGDSYCGEFVNGVKEGKGVMRFANGKVIEGVWKEDEIIGKGTLKKREGKKSIGSFKEKQKQGEGIHNSKREKV